MLSQLSKVWGTATSRPARRPVRARLNECFSLLEDRVQPSFGVTGLLATNAAPAGTSAASVVVESTPVSFSAQNAILSNGILGSLTGLPINLSTSNYNALVGADLNLGSLLSGVGGANSNVTLSQILNAASGTTSGGASTAAVL